MTAGFDLDALLAAEAAAIAGRYRTEPEAALAALRRAFAADPELMPALAARHGAEDVTRWRAYRRAVKAARQQVYHDLRRLKRWPEVTEELARRLARAVAAGNLAQADEIRRALAASHASTRERLEHAPELYRQILAAVPPPASILDLGAGLQPLMFPFHLAAPALRVYLALERDPVAVAAIEAFAPLARPTRLAARSADLAELALPEVRAVLFERAGAPARFDLALAMKLVSQVGRQERRLLPVLAAVPAEILVATESTVALTRRRSIARREARGLEEFARLAGRPVVARIEVPGELGLVLGPPDGDAGRAGGEGGP